MAAVHEATLHRRREFVTRVGVLVSFASSSTDRVYHTEGQWRYSLVTDKLTETMRIAKRVHALAQELNDSTLMIGGCAALAVPLLFGRFRDRTDNTRDEVFRSGARKVYSLRSTRLPGRQSVVCSLRPYWSGISERSPLASRPWLKRSQH